MAVHKLSKLMDCKVAFSTEDGDFEGILKLILVKSSRVTFEHVFLLPSRDYFGTMHVLCAEIISCNLLEPAHKILDVSKFDSSKELLNGGVEKNSRIDQAEVVQIPEGEHFLDYLPSYLKDENPIDYCIIDSTCGIFHRVVNDLSQQSTVGVSFHGPKLSRFGILSWVCISTSDHVFLFDIQQLGMEAVSEGLKSIFENKKIEKVIHDCRDAADCLLHKFHTNLHNVFDTQVADFLINMQMYTGEEMFRYVSSLDSCLVKYLKVPQQFLYNRNKQLSYDEEKAFFQSRPISHEFINVLLKSAMYLVSLKKLQEKLLLNPFEKAVELYLNVLRTASDSDVYLELKSEATSSAPAYLVDKVKSIRFTESLETPDDFVEKFQNTLHGQSVKLKNRRRPESL